MFILFELTATIKLIRIFFTNWRIASLSYDKKSNISQDLNPLNEHQPIFILATFSTSFIWRNESI